MAIFKRQMSCPISKLMKWPFLLLCDHGSYWFEDSNFNKQIHQNELYQLSYAWFSWERSAIREGQRLFYVFLSQPIYYTFIVLLFILLLLLWIAFQPELLAELIKNCPGSMHIKKMAKKKDTISKKNIEVIWGMSSRPQTTSTNKRTRKASRFKTKWCFPCTDVHTTTAFTI